MYQDNWWEQDSEVGAPGPTAPRPQAQAPGVIYGRPKQPDPLELRRDERAERAAARADAAASRQAEAAERKAAADELTAQKTREAEDKASAFLTRALGSNVSYEKTGVGPRSYVGGVLQDVAPGILNQLPSWMGNSPERQVSDSAQDEFIAASLRQDSGAAIPEEELERQRRIYFPQPGDGPEAIAQKRAARLRAIAGLEKSAGRALTPEQKKLLDQFRKNIDTAVSGEPVEDEMFREERALTPEALVDLLSGSVGGEYEIERDGLYHTPPGGKRERVKLTDEVANSDAYIAAYKAKFGEEPLPQITVTDETPSAIESSRSEMVADPIVRGIADTVTLGLADEIAAGATTLFSGGTMRENLARERGIDRADEEVNPYLRMGGQLVGGVAPLGRVFGRGPTGARPSAMRMAGEGAGLGGAYAFGSAEGDLGDRISAVPTGAVIGGAVGGTLGGIANRLGRNVDGGSPPPPTGRDVASAARDTGVDILPADVGGPITRGVTGAARQMFISELPIANKVAQAVDQAAEFRGATARSVGTPLDKADAGELVRKAANVYSKETGRQGSALYTRAEELAGATKVTPTKALQTLDGHIAELSETPGGSALLDELKALRSSLASGQFTIRGLRNMRTRIREEAEFRGLRGNDTDRRLKEVATAASEDIMSNLAESGNARAAQAFRAADDFWKARVETIDQVLEPLLGKNAPRSGEQILGALERMARRETGDADRLRRVVEAMPVEEAAGVRATFINRLGQPANAEEGAFSFADFVKRWDGMSAKAKGVLFPEDARKALDKLAKVAREAKATSAYSNTSNSARAIGGQAIFSTIVGLTPGGLPAVAGSAAGQYALGKLLTSKLFVNLLANTPKGDLKTFTRGLSNVARRDPALAQDALGLQRVLEQTFAQTPLRAAASTDEKKK